MGRARIALLAASAAAALAACQPRAEPYRFRGRLVGSVAAAEIDPGSARATAPAHRPLVTPGDPLLAAAEAIARPSADTGPSGLADELRSLVGVRDGQSTHLAFALDVLDHLGVALDDELRELATGDGRGADLVELARARDALDPRGPPLLGDLVVFDAVTDSEPASLVGVVVAADRAGTVELIHLSGGVVRRSFVNPRHPTATRDDDGRALNTFIRPGLPADPPDTKYLAGELFATFIRLDRLAH